MVGEQQVAQFLKQTKAQLLQATAELAVVEQERRATVIELKHRKRIEGSANSERLAEMTEGAAVIACFTLNAHIQSYWEVTLSLRTTEDSKSAAGNGCKQQSVVNMFTTEEGAMVGARIEIAVFKDSIRARHSRARASSGEYKNARHVKKSTLFFHVKL
jgi:hypothetical protein